ncbi:uncharacterized protein FIBRA_05060 [Fibroporia radiculosa]|uniref:TOG domain-containing protein n=1 Tax=Fibroporia radiculosa TaxID=599839 RepID=J4GQB7_9APHY|nr:uncharacterized protein FIBRA_05060 [Fibroporia radiculosa]CCM02945.1 predicted protein [Fibroporia radiculosa]
MGKSEIQSWIASTSTAADDDTEYGESSPSRLEWRRSDVLADWSRALEVARSRLLTSSTKKRLEFLSEELLVLAKHADLKLSQVLDLFQLLTLTYSRYVDMPSREAVEAVGMELVRRDELRGRPDGEPEESPMGVAEQIVGWLVTEVGRMASRGSSYASADIFVLLSWCCGLYTVCLQCSPDFVTTSSIAWNGLISVIANLVDLVLDDSTRIKPSIRKSALVRTRRALRSSPQNISNAMKALLLKVKNHPRPMSLAPLLGICVDVKIRLKNIKDESLRDLDSSLKTEILNYYTASILLSKTSVSMHVSTALNDFISTSITTEDFTVSVLPTMEKALLRSPEISLSVVTHFFVTYPHPVEGDSLRRILTPTLNSAKSTNQLVRAGSISLFSSIAEKTRDSSDVDVAAAEVLALPRAGKTAGPDHRATLYTILGCIRPSSSVSPSILNAGLPLLAKETHDAAVVALSSALVTHLTHCLHENVVMSPDAVVLLTKEMNGSKPVLRRAFCSLVGDAFWQLEAVSSDMSLALAETLLSSLETNLKTVAAGPLTSAAGPLEGYIALAIILSPLSRSGKFDTAISRNTTLQSILSTGSKPSFLLWEKVYQKLGGIDEEIWLLRAVQASLVYFKNDVMRNEQARAMMGLIFLHLAVESQYPQVRRSTISALESLTRSQPELTPTVVLSALSLYWSREGAVTSKVANGSLEEGETGVSKGGRLSALLLTSAAFAEDCDDSLRKTSLVNSVVLAHHPLLDSGSRQIWIECCQKARVDPHALVCERIESVFQEVMGALDIQSKTSCGTLSEASYRAITTIVFIAPEVVLPRVMQQLNADIDPDKTSSLSDIDLAIWATPDGQTYVDVLASKKVEEPQKKGKGYKDAQWEAEVRKSLASKKGSAPSTLSKQDIALLEAQLEKERRVRQRVSSVKAQLERGLNLVHSLVLARVDEFRVYLSSIVASLLRGAFGNAVKLVGSSSFERYLELAEACSGRLEAFSRWIGVATLRSLQVEGVPEDFELEPLNALVLRILHRLRSLSEQSPFDAATFAYMSPLLSQIFSQGGIAMAEEDDPLEQVALTVDIIKFHSGEFADPVFPRIRTLQDLLHGIKTQPKVAKEASSALIDIGQAMQSTASRDELDVLLRGTLQQEVYVRNSCLQTLQPFDLTDLDWSPELWIACHDDDDQNARLANHVWEDNGLDVPEHFLQDLIAFLEHENAYVRASCATALADAVLNHWLQTISKVLVVLQDFYREKAKVLAPEFDEYGMVIAQSLDRSDPWPTRIALARTFELLAPAFKTEDVEPFFTFLIRDQALGDRNADVRRGMLSAGTAVIDLHGAKRLPGLIAMFESQLSGNSLATETADHIKEAVVILFGRVARHLDPSDSRVPKIVERLVEALKTPAEQVQMAVSDCLVALVNRMRSPLAALINRLLDELFDAPKYAARRGAAYGLAGVIKGAGIASMKELNILERLKAAAEDKKRYEPRQGAMFAFETFSTTLGRLFEPYVIHILPVLLTSFGDATPDVREATHEAARVIMANMSGYGIKTITPSLLSGLDEKQWRTKKGSIELLGMMAYCAPRQLSQSLPIVIPRLTAVLTDAHAQVRVAANKSLKQFGEVISNPEIQALVPVFLKAMVDPGRTPNALTALLKTSFVHYIDHSSLALVVPIIDRGLRERSADTKRKAAQIIGNLASLTDSKDFVPYLSQLLPLVHVVLVDPVPEARATAAKALGTLVERLGEVHFPDLVPGLLRTLKTDTSGVDRQGAAQGLSEVLAGLGMERMEGLLPDIIANAQSPRSTVREGFMSLLVFLPATFGTRFQPHLPKIVPPILGGLSDTEDYVRDAAMRAGRMIVTNYSTRAIDLLLPELERGMFDPGWRIRQSSITLVGELLFKVSGISGKAEIEEDEEVVETAMAETSRRALVEVLGPERRDRILSALYLARQDAVNVVRQSSIHIWKALVHNTPRTVREILPELVSQVISLLAGEESDQQETAARTVAELCRKSGEKIFGEMISILKSRLASTDPKIREGVCLTLCELMESTTDNQREGHEDEIITMVRASLVDDEADVRAAAAKAFDTLQEHIGAKAIDQTIPTLLEALRQPGQSSGTALQALKEVMAVRASTVFPVLIPTLTAIPMSVFNARALASLVTVAGTALSKRLTVILTALAKVRESPDLKDEEELDSAISEAIRALLGSICDAEGLHTLMLLLLGWAKHEAVARRITACELLSIFCEESELDSSLYRIDWIRQLVSLMDDSEVEVHKAALHSLDAFIKSVPKDELEPLVVPLRRTIEGTGAPGRHVPGFSLPKGVAPTVPVIIAGLTTGSNEQREQAAYAIGDLVERTEENSLKPFVVQFTGPLIRVATQATTYPPAVKSAILTALATMLDRIPNFVKPFFPQLQRTFVKSASDPASLSVRNKAAQALGMLMRSQPRVDPVITELITGVKSNDDSIASSLVLALAYVVKNAGTNVGEKAREACVEIVAEAFREVHAEGYSQAVATLFSVISPPQILQPIIEANLLVGTPPSVLSSQCILAVLSPDDDLTSSDPDAPNAFQELGVLRSIAQKVQESVASDRPSISRPAREARDLLKEFDEAGL